MLRPWFLAGLLALAPAACQSASPRSTEPLRPPVPSPPGDAPLQQRIDWWESRLVELPPEDLSEAHLRLGDLYLEADRPLQARLEFRQALQGPLSQRETALARRGMGLSWILDQDPEAAARELLRALPFLESPELEETEALLAWCRGTLDPAALDADLARRLEPWLGTEIRELARAAHPEAGTVFYDVSRRDWQARPLRPGYEPMSRPYRITIHHTSEPFSSLDAAAGRHEVRRTQAFHQDMRGWADIGYHFLIDPAGRVYQGRELRWQGAHAGRSRDGVINHNVGNLGVCLLGNFVPQPDRGPDYARGQQPTPEQFAALERLVDRLREEYGISRSQVWGHSHFRETACPGPALEAWAERYRQGRVRG